MRFVIPIYARHSFSYHGHFQFYLLWELSFAFIYIFFGFICEASVRPSMHLSLSFCSSDASVLLCCFLHSTFKRQIFTSLENWCYFHHTIENQWSKWMAVFVDGLDLPIVCVPAYRLHYYKITTNQKIQNNEEGKSQQDNRLSFFSLLSFQIEAFSVQLKPDERMQ